MRSGLLARRFRRRAFVGPCASFPKNVRTIHLVGFATCDRRLGVLTVAAHLADPTISSPYLSVRRRRAATPYRMAFDSLRRVARVSFAMAYSA